MIVPTELSSSSASSSFLGINIKVTADLNYYTSGVNNNDDIDNNDNYNINDNNNYYKMITKYLLPMSWIHNKQLKSYQNWNLLYKLSNLGYMWNYPNEFATKR
jgi:transposase-like protein